MRRAGGPRSSACLEAETLAAWSEGTLPASETVAIERHVADCARCQALVAVFAKTEHVTAAAPPQRAWSLRWFLPLAAGTAAVATLIWIGRPDTPATPASQSARVEAPAPAVLPAASASAPPAPAAPAPEMVRPKPDTTIARNTTTAKKDTAAAKDSPLRQTAVTVPSAAPVEAQTLPPPPPAAPPPPPPPPPVTGDRSVQVQAAPPPARRPGPRRRGGRCGRPRRWRRWRRGRREDRSAAASARSTAPGDALAHLLGWACGTIEKQRLELAAGRDRSAGLHHGRCGARQRRVLAGRPRRHGAAQQKRRHDLYARDLAGAR
jgi:hypothetical protein